MPSVSTPKGVLEEPVNPIGLALSEGATFVARGFAGDTEHLAGLIEQAVHHKGFALIDVLQPCVTFNRQNTFEWYRQRTYQLGDDYDPRDRITAFAKALEWGEKIPLGIIYQNDRPTYEAQLGALKTAPLVKQAMGDPGQFEKLLDEFM
jgi:2-oxoglutarate ferredoxin oxidoreductase subunit beta